MDGKWTFNGTEDGLWCHEEYETREEAIEAGKEYYAGDDDQEIWVGQCQTVDLPTYVDVDDIFEQLNESYAQDCFEYDDFLFAEVKKEDREWLEGKLQDLMLEFYERAGIKSTEFTMTKVEKITV